MEQSDTTVVTQEKRPDGPGGNLPPRGNGDGPPDGGSGGDRSDGGRGGRPIDRRTGAPRPGFLTHYKPDQGKVTRRSTFIGCGLLITWGAWFLFDQLRIYEGDELWRMVVTQGIPILFAVVLGTLAWRVSFVSRKSSDFMIATEGEMKKVSWSSKREVIGSTKVVIVFTLLLAVLLFTVDTIFQALFVWIGVLKK